MVDNAPREGDSRGIKTPAYSPACLCLHWCLSLAEEPETRVRAPIDIVHTGTPSQVPSKWKRWTLNLEGPSEGIDPFVPKSGLSPKRPLYDFSWKAQ